MRPDAGEEFVARERRDRVAFALIDGRTKGQERVRESWSTTVLQWTKQRIRPLTR
jgi:hypothetical protein